ncbi:MAG: 50S ribosomal protein L6 [Candidatus Brocadiales bacterium]|nr:50S ribosomal protein L6 [Candidatus Bathyanammoxibius amoris]
MSRIGKLPVAVPQGVDVSISDQRTVKVKGPKGQLSQTLHPVVTAEYDSKDRTIRIKVPTTNSRQRAFQGLWRTLVANAVEGVTKGFTKEMEIVGLGYNVKLQGKNLVLALGHSKPKQVEVPEGITVQVTQPTNPAKFSVTGIDKQQVGEFAATVRRLRPVEPYKGKGIKYKDEVVRRKAGKAFAAQQ